MDKGGDRTKAVTRTRVTIRTKAVTRVRAAIRTSAVASMMSRNMMLLFKSENCSFFYSPGSIEAGKAISRSGRFHNQTPISPPARE
jgi:hypothetical protein